MLPSLPDSTIPKLSTRTPIDTFERDIARLLVVLYHCGRPVNGLLDGETRQIDSIWELQRFDFWVREPGHLALALLHTATTDDSTRRAALDQMIGDPDAFQLDIHRVPVPGAPYHTLEDFDYSLAFLTSRGLVSDRPSFLRGRSYGHQIILESAGITITRQILGDCPAFGWYQRQCETVAAYAAELDLADLVNMPYLGPGLSAWQAASVRLTPFVRARYLAIFDELNSVLNSNLNGDSANALV